MPRERMDVRRSPAASSANAGTTIRMPGSVASQPSMFCEW